MPATIFKTRILFVEDLVSDYELAKATIMREKISFDALRVETAHDMLNALKEFKPHIVISDYSMPQFDGMKALKLLLNFNSDIPLIILTGSMNEEVAVECIKAGAIDYVIKERMKRLPFAVIEALAQSKAKIAKRKAERALIKSEERFRELAENAQDLIYRFEFIPERKFIYVSPSATKITGYTPEEHYNDPEIWYKLIYPEDMHIVEPIIKGKTAKSSNVVVRWIKKNGKVIWTEQRNTLICDKNSNLTAIEGVIRDITDRIEAEAALKEMQQMAQATLNSIGANICVIDENGDIISVNKSWEEFAQQNAADMGTVSVGANYFTACEMATDPDKEDARKFLQGIKQVLQGEKHYFEMEYQCNSPKEKRWFNVRVTPFESQKPTHNLVVVAHENITQQKLAEISVRDSEERYSTFLNSTTDIAFIKDEKLNYIFINKAGLEFFSKKPDEIIGKDVFELLEHEHAHNCSLSDRQSLERNGIVVSVETIYDKIYETRKFPLKLKNGEIGVAGFIREVTDWHNAQQRIKESEKKYRNLVENSLVGVYSTNTKGEFLFANNALAQILEFSSPSQLLKSNVISHYKYPEQREAFLSLLREKGSLENYEVEMISNKGNKKTILLSATITGKIIVGMMMDITEQKRAVEEIMAKNYEIETQNEEYRTLNEELLIAKEKAEESDKLKTAFLQNLSHEIRTPMNGIVGFTQLLKEKKDNPEVSEQYLEVIERSGDRLMNLISDLVDISVIETGQFTVAKDTFNVNELLNGLKGFYIKDALEKGLELRVTSSLSKSNALLTSDKDKVFQVLSNLIKNAIKFTESGGVEIGCIAKNNELVFSVKDTGIGIEPSKYDVIFERFIQGDISISRGYEGAGLGLSISKSYVEALGGKMWLESELGKGSTFKFALPCTKAKSETFKTNNMETPYDPSNDNLKVLVVEDDVVSRMLLNEILNDCNMNVSFARNGQEAVEKVEADSSYDFILMDLKMPIMNGYEATEVIRKMGYKKPIIAQTAYASITDKSRVLASGFDAYLPKPLSKNKLLEILKAIKGE